MVLRKERTGIEKKFYDLCLSVVKDLGLEVYDMDYIPGSYTLRVFILDPATGTAVIENCVAVDRAMSPHVEELDWMPAELTLEVSSPGVYRSLTTLDHFKGAEGERAEFTIIGKLDSYSEKKLPKKLKGQKRFLGYVKSVLDDSVDVEVAENVIVNLKFENIKKANLEPVIE